MKLLLLIIVLVLSSCNKLLQQNPSSTINTPDTFEEMMAMFNDRNTMNVTPGLPDLSADNLYLSEAFWAQQNLLQKNAYLWQANIYGDDTTETDYDLVSKQIRNANMVLEGLNSMQVTNTAQWNNMRAQALFFRSCAFYYMASLFCKPYTAQTAATDAGIPLRVSTAVEDRYPRATVLQTYHRIVSDLKVSIRHLEPVNANKRLLPSKAASYAMLARIYQSMNLHDTAGVYADSCLQLCSRLVNYNSLGLEDSDPFGKENPEIIFETWSSDKVDALKTTFAKGCFVDSGLYASYPANDLRKDAFYSGQNFKRSYAGSSFAFSGIATDELYLIKAESEARKGNKEAAMDWLNKLLQKRWLEGTFKPCTTPNAAEALEMVLRERRKELPLRGLRWADLRRLNIEGYGITPQRRMSGNTYVLPPNSRLYILPFPPDVIQITNIQQNER